MHGNLDLIHSLKCAQANLYSFREQWLFRQVFACAHLIILFHLNVFKPFFIWLHILYILSTYVLKSFMLSYQAWSENERNPNQAMLKATSTVQLQCLLFHPSPLSTSLRVHREYLTEENFLEQAEMRKGFSSASIYLCIIERALANAILESLGSCPRFT